MGSLFGGGGGSRSHFGQTSQRGVRGRDTMLNDLLGNALAGSLYPQPLGVPTALSQGIGGLQELLPSLFGQGFGPNRGLAGMLSGRPMDPAAGGMGSPPSNGSSGPGAFAGSGVPPASMSSSGGGGGMAGLLSLFPQFGNTPSREDLGLVDPSLAPPGFLPPQDVAAGNLPGARTGVPDRFRKFDRRIGNMQERQADLEASGLSGRADRLGNKIAQKQDKRERVAARRGYLPTTPGHYNR